MNAELLLLSVSIALATGGIAHLAIACKRIAEAAFSEALNGAAKDIR